MFTPIELVGYAASALVVVSLAMTSVVRLRIINLGGAAAFVAYGILIGSIPIVLTNATIAAINVVFLARVWRSEALFTAVETRSDAPLVGEFLSFHRRDILRFAPGFGGLRSGDVVFWLLRDATPAGILAGSIAGDVFDVALDYVTPSYRDFEIGGWLYGPDSPVFRDRGIRTVSSHAGSERQRRYLVRMGFEPRGDRFVRRVGSAG